MTFLRALGVFNAAVWVGSTVFFTFFAGPAFFSDEMIGILTKPYAGAAAQVVIKRLFWLQLGCLTLAWTHLVFEYIYLGRQVARDLVVVLTVLLVLISLGSFHLQPKLRSLHKVKYGPISTEIQRHEADQSFKTWHGVSQTLNLFVLLGQLYYFYRLQSSMNNPRFVPTTKFRG
jgi:hypothetical protein